MTKKPWQQTSVVQLAFPTKWSLNGGPFGSKLVSSMYTPSGVPVIRGCNLPFNARFDETEFVFVSEKKALELKQHEARPGDLIITQRGTLGQVGLIPKEARFKRYIVSQSQMKLTPDPTKVDPLFLYHVFRAPDTVRRIEDLALRSGVPHINLSILRDFEVSLPPLLVQNRIASILGAYDDLIEVNRRRIAVLEEMARRLFDEWFVQLKFPEHEQTTFDDGPDGPVPNGWRRTELHEVADVNARVVKPGTAPTTIRYVDIASVSPGAIDQISELPFSEAPGRARRRVKDGSTIWSTVRPNRRSYALVLDPSPDLIVSTGFAVLDASLVPFTFLYCAVTRDEFVGYLTNHATGSAYPAVTGTTFEKATLLVPSDRLLQAFDRLVEPQLRLADRLRRTQALLARSRDHLLPRLISGDLSVAVAEQELADAA